MARSIQEIYDAIIEEKKKYGILDGLTGHKEGETQHHKTLLADLSSKSRVAVWRLWAFITAAVINIHEQLWDLFKKEVEELKEGAFYGTPAWYEKQALRFQLGDQLKLIDGQPGYAADDPSKKIIKRASLSEVVEEVTNKNILVLKVAKEVDGVLKPLDENEDTKELSKFKFYMQLVKPAGVPIQVISQEPDYLRVKCTVFYDPLMELEGENGGIKENVEAAIKNHLKNLDFNGIIYTQKLTDAIQAAEGVIDVSLLDCTVRVGSDIYSFDNIEPVGVAYQTAAGYILPEVPPADYLDEVIDDDTDHSLEASIVYTKLVSVI